MGLPAHLSQVHTVCVQALASPIGLRLRVSKPDLFRNRFYQVRKMTPEPQQLDLLSAPDGATLLVRKDQRNG